MVHKHHLYEKKIFNGDSVKMSTNHKHVKFHKYEKRIWQSDSVGMTVKRHLQHNVQIQVADTL